jgi:glycosyltransferase involved in cell wall biosynthesis
VVIPALNEERAIAGCLERFITQDYPLDRLEILVADGRSQDRTREIIQELAEKHTYPTIRLVDNPERITPCALNAGIQHSTGEIVIIFGAHSYAETDYVSQTVRTLAETDAGAVGGALDEIGHNFMGNAIGAARNSLIGGAISPHRYSTQPGYADTVRFAGYRREVFHAAGLFDPELVRNQDDEFNYRVRASGFKLYFNPAIRATYYTRGSFQRLWRQLYQYGYWKPRVLQKNPSCFSVQFLIPPLFVVTLVGFALLGWFWKPAWALLALELLTYTLLTGAFATKIALKRGGKFWLPVFLCYWVIHLSIGLGTLAGLSRLATPLKPVPKLALDTATTAVQS